MASPLNHNHLYYFWLAGKYRNLTQAAKELGLAQPTVSAQIRSLEEQLNAALLTRRGRNIELTEAGQIVFRHADEMFQISSEIPDALTGRFTGQPRVLHVGTSDFVPKPIIRHILAPLLKDDPDVRLVCREWRIDELLAELGLFHLDLVIADRPHPDSSKVRAISHPVLESAMAIYARPALARQLRRGFPRSLHGAPMYLPVRNTTLRASMASSKTGNCSRRSGAAALLRFLRQRLSRTRCVHSSRLSEWGGFVEYARPISPSL